MDSQKMLVEYVRDKNRKPFACLVAVKDSDNQIVYGFSKCKKCDNFNKEIGREIALGRVKSGTNAKIPFSITPAFENFVDRCNRYFFKNETKKKFSTKKHMNSTAREIVKSKKILKMDIVSFSNYKGKEMTWANIPYDFIPAEIHAIYKGKTIVMKETVSGLKFVPGSVYIPRDLFF